MSLLASRFVAFDLNGEGSTEAYVSDDYDFPIKIDLHGGGWVNLTTSEARDMALFLMSLAEEVDQEAAG